MTPGRARLGGLAALLAAWGMGCGPPDAGEAQGRAAGGEAGRGGTAVVGGREPVATLNPLVSTDYMTAQLQKHALFVTLVRHDSALQVRPYLAESWTLSPDSTEVTFRLRGDVSWHDGTPTTARDVEFTFRRAKDPRVPFPNRTFFDLWEEAEVVDDRTIRFALQPHAGFLYGWTETAIVPEHVLGGVPPEALANHPFGTSSPLGNGPFRFAGREGTDLWRFEANPGFPGGLGGPPRVDRLVYRVVPDETTLLSEFRAGRVHLYVDLPPSQIRRAREVPGARVVTYPGRAVAFIAWNTRRPQLSDARVRRALTLAIDRWQLVEVARNGLGTVASGPVGPWHWAHDPSWEPLPYAPDSAGALLERAGWRDGDGDGVREREGVPLRLELLINENPVRRDIAVMVQEQLARVGVGVRPRVRETASLAALVTSPSREFDAVVLAFVQGWTLDDRDLWSCDRRDRPFHFTGYCDPGLDAVLDSIPRTLDREAQRRLYRRYHRAIAEAQPYTYLYFEIVAAGVRGELQGARPDARGDLVSARDWRLEPGARRAASP